MKSGAVAAVAAVVAMGSALLAQRLLERSFHLPNLREPAELRDAYDYVIGKVWLPCPSRELV